MIVPSAKEEAGQAKDGKKSYWIGEVATGELSFFKKLLLPEGVALLLEAPHRLLAVGALDEGRPVGLALADCAQGGSAAQLHSIYVEPEQRRRGVGQALLRELEDKLHLKGYRSLLGEFIAEAGSELEKTAFFAASGFAACQPGIYIRGGFMGPLLEQSWMHAAFPDTFSVQAWESLASAERKQLEQAKGTDYPELLSPFYEEECVDAQRSLLLRYKGLPVGWVMMEALDEQTMLFKTMHVHKRHRRLARGITLFAAAIRNLLEEGIYTNGICFVEAENEGMRAFTEKYFYPLRKEVLWRTHKSLV